MSASARTPASLDDLLAMPEEERYEIVDGILTPKEAGSGKHGRAQVKTSVALDPFHRKPGGPPSSPGGWHFATEAIIQFSPAQIRRPDVAGWKRDRLPQMPAAAPITVLPDWLCEILSPSNASNDTILKMRLYHQAKISHYWLLDPIARILAVYRFTPEGYLHILGATHEQVVRAEPFDAVDLAVADLFGEDD